MNRLMSSVDVLEWVESLRFFPESIVVWDKSGHVIGTNRSDSSNMFGLESSFVQGKHYEELPISSLTKKELQQVFSQENLSSPTLLQTHTTVNGRSLTYSTEFRALTSQEYISISREKQSSHFGPGTLESLYAKMNEPIAFIDATGLILFANECFQEKVVLEDPIGKSFSSLSFESEEPIISSAISNARKNHTSKFETMIERRWYRAMVHNLPGFEEGDRFMLRLDDVTDEKSRELEEKGKQSLLNDALSRVEEAVFLIHLSGRVVFCNPQAAMVFKSRIQTVSELQYILQGKIFSINGKEAIIPDSLGIFRAIEGDRPEKERFLLFTGGEHIGLESSVKPLGTSVREEPYLLWTLRDITIDTRRIAGLEEDNSEMDHFMRATAHDLRTPVNNLNNLGKLIAMTEEPKKVKALASEIQKSASNLASLFGGMMELARYRSEEKSPASEVSFELMLEEIHGLLQTDLEKKRITWKQNVQVPSIHYQRTFLRSIMYNLLVNAVKYADPQKDQPMLSIQIQPSTNGCWLTVEDNGIGMNLKKVRSDLFQPFKRFSLEEKGSGIGLSLVKRFVEKNGGEIQVESTPGKGTAFRVFLRSYENNTTQYNLFQSED